MKISDLELINCVNQAALEALNTALVAWGFRVFYLRGESITDKKTLLAQVERDLPMSAGLRPHNWDAFVDCLRGGLSGLVDERVAIVWTHAHLMLSSDLQDFLIAIRSVTDVARHANTGGAGFSHEMALHIFLVGMGSSFRSFPPEENRGREQ
jgi:Barstar (barnase inhibitor)